ncbi:MAG: asparagine synthase (glutamine-hydrolyzing) [Bryobacterales bacterium]|nr:asparagine synthase (glutamine-hydrolyzing) [Bryobacterales bacterium]
MCGIAGFTHLSRPAGSDRISRAARALVHRGPDQQGIYQSERVSLGAVRLKIIDLAAGDQPMVSADGGTVLVFNGEIYNRAELRRELAARGRSFAGHGDTEVVLQAFLEWGRQCLPRLRGMFALAVWEESSGRLLLARDRMGIKPLYLLRRGDELYFASELKAILCHAEVDRRIDPVGLHYYLGLNYVPGPHTLVEGIGKLPPGHWLEWRSGRVETGAYWRLDFRPDRTRTIESAKEELDCLLQSAVREHLVSDVPLGLWSSGGLDSTTILHYAAQAAPGRLKTFSVSFPGRSFDESRYFRLVSSVYGTDHHQFNLNPGADLASVIEDLVRYADEPTADAGAVPVWYLARMSRRHVTVALSGEGADELFGGYVTYLAGRLAGFARRVPAGIRRLALLGLRHWPASDEKIGFDYKLQRFLAGSLMDPDEAHVYWNGTFSEAEKRALYGGGGPDAGAVRLLYEAAALPAADAGPVNRYLCFDQLRYLPDDILAKCDRMSMAHSLEVRPPFLDHRIVEFAASLPENFKVRGRTLKYLLRDLMRAKLPGEIIRRKKEGLDIPIHDWFRGPLRALLLDTLSEEAVRRHGLFRPEVVRSLIGAHLERRANLGYHLWGLLILFLWLRTWRIETAPCALGEEGVSARASAGG